MRPTSLHSNFFSSLKQVEKRLKLESPTQPFNLPHVGTNDTSTESLNFDKGNHEKESFCDDSCRCEGGFYEKIVGAKGPKCKKEVERLEGGLEICEQSLHRHEQYDQGELKVTWRQVADGALESR
ncbi:hypothetical protein GH714_043129 [Hevea brasiliensis]|uniref:Uncharacterized protein n=1 Tax=Hevea brasiliensis TaxID=3981 RepID=A0A6A6K3S6_HEVBR|nr:hypothetical protein GH714_043129 [Hevea brasiliensis]